MGFRDNPWVFGGSVRIQTGIGRVFGILWAAALAGFIGAAAGMLLRQQWWGAIAVAGSLVPILAILPWWNAVAPGFYQRPGSINVLSGFLSRTGGNPRAPNGWRRTSDGGAGGCGLPCLDQPTCRRRYRRARPVRVSIIRIARPRGEAAGTGAGAVIVAHCRTLNS